MNPTNPTPSSGAGPPPPPLTPVVKKQRFGLVQLIVLVGTLGLLAAIIIPHFVKARITACKSSCISNLKRIDGAVQQWALENKKEGTNTVPMSELLGYLPGRVLPVCDEKGVYAVATVSGVPTCTQSARGHSL